MTSLTEEVLMRTADLAQMGLRPRRGELPSKVEEWRYHSRTGTRHLWRLDQCEPIRRRVLTPAGLRPTAENVLRATCSVNRAAKRRRDAASSSYHASLHGLAGHHRRRKEEYYDLKDRGIAWLAVNGHLHAQHRHAGLIVWLAGGESFHATLAPTDWKSLPDCGSDPVFIAAEAATSRDMRLLDAVDLLSGLEDHRAHFVRLPPPPGWLGDDGDEDEDDEWEEE